MSPLEPPLEWGTDGGLMEEDDERCDQPGEPCFYRCGSVQLCPRLYDLDPTTCSPRCCFNATRQDAERRGCPATRSHTLFGEGPLDTPPLAPPSSR